MTVKAFLLSPGSSLCFTDPLTSTTSNFTIITYSYLIISADKLSMLGDVLTLNIYIASFIFQPSPPPLVDVAAPHSFLLPYSSPLRSLPYCHALKIVNAPSIPLISSFLTASALSLLFWKDRSYLPNFYL